MLSPRGPDEDERGAAVPSTHELPSFSRWMAGRRLGRVGEKIALSCTTRRGPHRARDWTHHDPLGRSRAADRCAGSTPGKADGSNEPGRLDDLLGHKPISAFPADGADPCRSPRGSLHRGERGLRGPPTWTLPARESGRGYLQEV